MLNRIMRVISTVVQKVIYILLILLSCIAASLIAGFWYYDSLIGVVLCAYALLVFLVTLALFRRKRFRAWRAESQVGWFVSSFVYSAVVWTFIGLLITVHLLVEGDPFGAGQMMFACSFGGPVITIPACLPEHV